MDSVRIELPQQTFQQFGPYLPSIAGCFGVEIVVCENVSRDQPWDGSDHGCEDHLSMAPTNLKLLASSKETITKAKTFFDTITSSTGPGFCERHLTLSPEHLTALLPIYHAVEQKTCTVFRINGHTRAVSILGLAPDVNMAQSLITDHLAGNEVSEQGAESLIQGDTVDSQYVSPTRRGRKNKQTLAPTLRVQMGPSTEDEETGHKSVALGLSLSPGAESAHDSCYDSDGSLSRRSSTDHTDVSRTVSDTLAAEHSETETTPSDNLRGESPTSFGNCTIAGLDCTASALTMMTTTEALDAPEVVSCPVSAGFGVDENHRYEILVKQDTLEFKLSTALGTAEQEADGGAQHSSSFQDENSHSSRLLNKVSSYETPTQDVRSFSDLPPTFCGTIGSSSLTNYSDIGNRDISDSEDDTDLKAVQYGIRLGYSQQMIRRVLEKLGPEANKDALLQELILHTDEKEEDEEEDEEVVDCPWVLPSPPPVSPSENLDCDEVDGGNRTLSHKVSGTAEVSTEPVGGAGSPGSNLRSIIIDGSNIAMSHGNKQVFSCRGIRLAVDYFKARGHKKVTVFVPSWRKEASRQDTQILDQEVLYALEKEKSLIFTPSRWVKGKRIVCYDDLYIIKAAEEDGIVVSNDNYRDVINKDPKYKQVIEERLLMYSFFEDRFMPPDDPLGRRGPSLDNFLSKHPVNPEPLPPICPYAKKCTYGNKCKYYHPERGLNPRKSVIEVLQEKEKVEIAKVRTQAKSRESSPGDIGARRKSPTPSKNTLGKTQSLSPVPKQPARMALSRTRSLAPGQVSRTTHSESVHSKPLGSQHPNRNGSDMLGGGKLITTTGKICDINELSLNSYRAKVNEPPENDTVKSDNDITGARADSLHAHSGWSTPSDENRKMQPLRTTNTEPATQLSNLCGHLLLAKKLSDEGCKDEENRHTGFIGQAGQVSQSMSPHHQSDANVNNNSHQKLSRQLSLKGVEDTRLQGKPVLRNQNQKFKEKQASNNPLYHFHGPTTHIPPGSWHRPDSKAHTATLGPGMTFTIGDHQKQHRNMGPDIDNTEHVGLSRHSSLHSDKVFETQKNLHIGSERIPACRMASAPLTFSYLKPNSGQQSQMAQCRSSMIMPTIQRQNSTSDPQLHTLHQDTTQGGVDMRMLGMYQQQQHQQRASGCRGFTSGIPGQETGGNNLPWQQVHQFEVPAGNMKSGRLMEPENLNYQQHEEQHLMHRQAFEGYVQNHNSFDGNIRSSGSFEDIGTSHLMEKSRSFEGQLSVNDQFGASLGGNGRDLSYYQPQQDNSPDHKPYASNNKPYGSDQSLFIPPTGSNEGMHLGSTHLIGPRKSSPDLYNLQYSSFLAQQQAAQLQQQPHQDMFQHQQRQQDMYQTSMSHHQVMNSMSPAIVVGGDSCLGRMPANPPHPEDQSPGAMAASQSNSRETLFYHLCGLFDEAKVREAMRRMPNEMQADKLCGLILSL